MSAAKRGSSIREIRAEESLRSKVESSLAAAIISGELDPGVLVSVPALAAKFAVSATPVREAMLDLEKRGFVEPVKNKGFRVTTVGERDLLEIVQLRTWIEVPAMRIVAERLRGARVDEYHALADRIVTAADQGDFRAYLAADSSFHLGLLAVTDNRRLVEIDAELRRQTRMVGLVGMRNSDELRRSAQEHHELLALLVAGDAEGAEALLVHHIRHARGWWAGRAEPDDEADEPSETGGLSNM